MKRLFKVIAITLWAAHAPQICYAQESGSVVVSGIAGVFVNIVFGLYILFSNTFAGYRLPAIIIYGANVVVLWLWASDCRGSETTWIISFFVTTLATFACLVWFCTNRRSRKGQ
jgi:hypothetical protein